jgi:hypothetical protein
LIPKRAEPRARSKVQINGDVAWVGRQNLPAASVDSGSPRNHQLKPRLLCEDYEPPTVDIRILSLACAKAVAGPLVENTVWQQAEAPTATFVPKTDARHRADAICWAMKGYGTKKELLCEVSTEVKF